MRTLLSRIRALFMRGGEDARLDDEVRLHVDELAAEYMRRGATPDQARRAARRTFGGVEQMKEQHRDGRGFRWVEDAWRDVRYAVRMLRRDRALAAIAVITLALGIGANTALFSVIDALMLRRLPVTRPDELRLFTIARSTPIPGVSFSYPLYEDFQTKADAFSGVIAAGNVNPMRVAMGGEGSGTDVARSQGVSGNFFSVLNVAAAAGRVLAAITSCSKALAIPPMPTSWPSLSSSFTIRPPPFPPRCCCRSRSRVGPLGRWPDRTCRPCRPQRRVLGSTLRA
jgi:hypothetical protein